MIRLFCLFAIGFCSLNSQTVNASFVYNATVTPDPVSGLVGDTVFATITMSEVSASPRFGDATWDSFGAALTLTINDPSVAVFRGITAIGTLNESGLNTNTLNFDVLASTGLASATGTGYSVDLAIVELELLSEGVTTLQLLGQGSPLGDISFLTPGLPPTATFDSFDSFGSTTVQAVPEPTSLALVGLASAGAFCSRRVRGRILRRKKIA